VTDIALAMWEEDIEAVPSVEPWIYVWGHKANIDGDILIDQAGQE